MTNLASWLIALVLALCVVGLIAYARGPKHYRGDEIGSHGTKVALVVPAGVTADGSREPGTRRARVADDAGVVARSRPPETRERAAVVSPRAATTPGWRHA